MAAERLIYLASPYTATHKPGVNHQALEYRRFVAVCRAAGRLMRAGEFVLSPIAHTHPIKVLGGGLTGDWQRWAQYDRLLIERCDEVWVLRLPDWETSVGVGAEIELAKDLGKPVAYVEPLPPDLAGLGLEANGEH